MEIVGDPASMEAAAANLRLRADQVLEAAHHAAAAVSAAVYAGPAADRLRAATADRRQRLVGVANQLHDLADTLSRSAVDVAEARAEAARAALPSVEDDC